MSVLQNYLISGGSSSGLLQCYGINHRRHTQHPNLVSFKYNQIVSPMHEPIVQEARGIVLDESDGWRIVGRGFDKFFNYGEPHAASIDWTTARVQEKIDGSLCIVYEYGDAWHVATTGTPDAAGDINGNGRFADLFWDTAHNVGLRLPDPSTCRDYCFLFELTGPANRIVVIHERAGLTVLGARSRVTGMHISPCDASALLRNSIPAVREFSLRTLDEIHASFVTMSPLSQEGYVVVDNAHRRIKVKHPGYVALHHAKDGMTEKAIVDIARKGETSEVLTAFPEYRRMVNDAAQQIDTIITKIEAAYAPIADIAAQKDFAAYALSTPFSAALFAIRAKKARSARCYVASMRLETLMEWIEREVQR